MRHVGELFKIVMVVTGWVVREIAEALGVGASAVWLDLAVGRDGSENVVFSVWLEK
jgi:hypothetical protein